MLPAPVQADNYKLAIANITNSHLRNLVVRYDAKKNKSAPLAVAENLWAVINWTWQNHRDEAEQTIRKHMPDVADVDAWLEAEYQKDVATYSAEPVPAG